MLNQENKDILLASQAGVEFEFYSNHSVDKTAEMLEKTLGRKMQIEDKAHSDFTPTDKVFKLEPDMSGGAGLIEMVTGPLPYTDVRLLIIKMFKWIDENGYTNDRCGLHLNISFKSDIVGNSFITNMNTLKFILEFKEDQVFKFFPKRKDLIYAKSIKYILPIKGFTYFNENTIDSKLFHYPSTKYYGVNFLKKENNYLEFRYLGGKDYQKRTTDTLHLLDLFTVQLFQVCANPGLTELNRLELRKIMHDMQPIINLYKDHRNFDAFPEIMFTLDLMDDDGNRGETKDMFWSKIQEQIINLISMGGMKSGEINYDTDRSKVQVKSGVFKGGHSLEGYEFVDCDFSGSIKNCDFYNCRFTNSDIETSNLYQGCKVSDSKIKSSYVHSSCIVEDSYVFGNNGVFKGTMKGGIFREGNYSEKTAKFDGTEIVQSKKIN
tara:strand:+ start:1424 stop:2728 length:1305 start_codon:yes stop_codon:yes gene_type:complete